MLVSSLNNAARRGAAAAAGLLLVLLGACSDDVYERRGTWQASGVNDSNLTAMLVNKPDALSGTGALTARGDSSARAVTRLLTDRRRPLLNVTTSRIGGDLGSPADPSLPSGGGSSSGAAPASAGSVP